MNIIPNIKLLFAAICNTCSFVTILSTSGLNGPALPGQKSILWETSFILVGVPCMWPVGNVCVRTRIHACTRGPA